MTKIELAEEIIKNSQSYRLKFITYEREEDEIIVTNGGGYFNTPDLMIAIEVIGLNTMLRMNKAGVELLIYSQ